MPLHLRHRGASLWLRAAPAARRSAANAGARGCSARVECSGARLVTAAPRPDLAAIRARHREYPLAEMLLCRECADSWPCDAIELADALEAAQARIDMQEGHI